MKNVIFIAPPAAGKGTQSEILVQKGYIHISSGNMLRNEINLNTPIGNAIKKQMAAGELIEDELIFEIISQKINNLSKPFILDGFPRDLKQAKMLNDLFQELSINNYEVIYLDIAVEEALKRALGRLTCSCGATYNLNYKKTKPQNDGICDKCHQELIIRSDDNDDTVKNRFATFIQNAEDLKKYYLKKNKLHVIDVSIGLEEVAKKIKEILL